MGLTQQQLGDILGIDRSAIAHYENGSSFPIGRNIQKICDVLGVPIEKLFKQPVQNCYQKNELFTSLKM